MGKSGESTLGIPLDGSTPVWIGLARPNDGDHAHRKADRPYTVVNVPIRRPHRRRAHARHVLDDLSRPPQLGHDLFICHLGQSQQVGATVRPRVNGDFMSCLVLIPDHLGSVQHPRPDHEKGRLEGLALEVGEQFGRVEAGSVVVRVSVLHRILTGCDVDVAGALATRPPAPTAGPRLSECFSIGGVLAVGSVGSDGVVWDGGPVDFGHPLADFGTVCWGYTVCWRVAGGIDSRFRERGEGVSAREKS